jgi:methyl-accepting chemotaxis protein
VKLAQGADERIHSLSQAASKIGNVVDLINSIAGQTILLALNATIEAARAVDAGKGFAVVASEVKILAEQTSKATTEIGQQVAGIQSATQESVATIKEVSNIIGRISEIASAIGSTVEEQGAATQEITRSAQQAAKGTGSLVQHLGREPGGERSCRSIRAGADGICPCCQAEQDSRRRSGALPGGHPGRVAAVTGQSAPGIRSRDCCAPKFSKC